MSFITPLFFSLRPSHWIKNFFIFIPLIFGKQLFNIPYCFRASLGFCFFSMASSAAYLMNDMADVDHDKLHPTKKLRPLAAGKVNIKAVKIASVFLAFLSLAGSFMMSAYFGLVIFFYLILNYAYSEFLKEIVIIDVFCLAVFFLLRIFAGSLLVQVEISYWLIIMVSLLSLFLGFNKRRQELKVLTKKAFKHRHVLFKYNFYFIDQMIVIITSSIVIAYMLYTLDARTVKQFGTNKLIYSIPFVYYGVFRYLYLIHKIGKEADPTRILLADKMMQINLMLWIGVCVMVIYLK